MTVDAYYTCIRFGGVVKLVAYDMFNAVSDTGVMQQAALVTCIIFMCLNATEQHFVCCPKWRLAIRSVTYPSNVVCYTPDCYGTI